MWRKRWMLLLVTAMVVAISVPALARSGIFSRGDLADLALSTEEPTDGARAGASASVANGHTVVVLNVKELNRAAAGTTFGAHVHVGPCVPGNGAAALGHYNHGGGVSPDTEVWLDFTVTQGGTGHAEAIVPFEIPAGGAHSVVIHALPTADNGSAGSRMACLPLEF